MLIMSFDAQSAKHHPFVLRASARPIKYFNYEHLSNIFCELHGVCGALALLFVDVRNLRGVLRILRREDWWRRLTRGLGTSPEGRSLLGLAGMDASDITLFQSRALADLSTMMLGSL